MNKDETIELVSILKDLPIQLDEVSKLEKLTKRIIRLCDGFDADYIELVIFVKRVFFSHLDNIDEINQSFLAHCISKQEPHKPDEVYQFFFDEQNQINYHTFLYGNKKGLTLITPITVSAEHPLISELVEISHDFKIDLRYKNQIDFSSKTEKLLQDANIEIKIGTWALYLENNEVYWSRGVYDIYELPTSIIPTLDLSLSIYEDKEIVLNMLDETTLRQGEVDFITRITSKKNNLKIVRISARFNQETNSIIGTFEDVTEQQKQQQTTFIGKDTYKALLNGLKGAAYRCRLDDNWTMEFLSDGMYDLSEYQCDEFFGIDRINLSDIILPEDHEKAKEVFEKAIEKGKSFELEYRIRTKSGEIRWVNDKGEAVFNEQDEILYLEGILIDITKRKTSELLLLKQQKLLTLKAKASSLLLHSENPKQVIFETLQELVKEMDADQAYYIEMATLNGVCTGNLQFECYRDGREPAYNHPNYQNLPCEMLGDIGQKLIDGEYVTVLTSDIEKGSFLRQFIEIQGVESFILVPVVLNNQTQAFIGFDQYGEQREWSEFEISLLLTFADNIGHALQEEILQKNILEAKDMLQQLTNGSPNSIFVKDKEGKYVFVNQVFADFYSTTPEQIIGKTDEDYSLNQTKLEMYRNQDQEVLKRNSRIVFEDESVVLPDGEIQWYQTTKLPLSIGEEKDNLILGVVTDVTQRKKFELELIQSSDLQKMLMKIATQFINISLSDVDFQINKALGEIGDFIQADRVYIFEYDYEKQLTRNTFEWCNDGITPEIHNLQELPIILNEEWYFKHQVGDIVYIEDVNKVADPVLKGILDAQDIKSLMTIPMMDGSTCTGFVGIDHVRAPHSFSKSETDLMVLFSQVLLNVQLRTKTSSELIKTSKQLASIMENLSECIWSVITPDYNVIYMTPSYKMIYELEEEWGNGGRWEEFVHFDDKEVIKHIYKDLNETGKYEYEYRIITKKGNVKWIRNSGKIAVENNETRIDGITSDITNLKEKENEIKLLLENSQNQNKRLQHFTHIVSHNLRSHSGNISMLLDNLVQDDEKLRDNILIKYLFEASNNLLDTLENLNQVTSLSSSEKERFEKVNVREYIDKACNNISSLILNSDVEVMINVAKDDVVNVVPAYLDSITLNFITNAIRYRDPNKPNKYLRISFRKEEKYDVLIFEDNGLGIDLQKNRDKLFGMYKTFHSNADSRGIGLFLVKNQIETMGGRIEVESEVSKGTVFKIYFVNL